MIAPAIAAVSLAAWVYLALARGGFWRARDDEQGAPAAASPTSPRIVAVIPARDEAALVGTTVASLLTQRGVDDLSVIVVDDHSSDGTADVARRAADAVGASGRLTVLSAPPLPPDWKGKLWALAQGIARCDAAADPPDWLLLTDADIEYDPTAVAALVSSAIANRLVMSSLMVELRCQSAAERALIPAFVFFFQMLYPFSWVNQAHRRTAAAAGGCSLIYRSTLADAGGIASIRDALIDDCALARRLKPLGPIRLALGERVRSLRPYASVADIRHMIVRSAYAQLGYSPALLVGVVIAMAVVFVAPVVLAVLGTGWTRALAAAAWILMALLFGPMLARYRMSRLWGIALPAIAATYLVFTVESAIQHALGRGGRWKGRVHRAARAATAESP